MSIITREDHNDYVSQLVLQIMVSRDPKSLLKIFVSQKDDNARHYGRKIHFGCKEYKPMPCCLHAAQINNSKRYKL